jgi:hypothetical protein
VLVNSSKRKREYLLVSDFDQTLSCSDSGGELLSLLTIASTFEEAFQIAKSAYQASSYPKVGVDQFLVHGICKSSTCPCGGDDHFVLFTVDWSTNS